MLYVDPDGLDAGTSHTYGSADCVDKARASLGSVTVVAGMFGNTERALAACPTLTHIHQGHLDIHRELLEHLDALAHHATIARAQFCHTEADNARDVSTSVCAQNG